MIAPADYQQVPDDLLNGSSFVKHLHQWKAAAAVRACIPLTRMFSAPRADRPGILMYHRVVPTSGASPPTWNVTPDRFREQLAGLVRRGYTAWPLTRLVEAFQNQSDIPDNIFVVTFDDGYANNYLHALPILQELQIPATIFLATAYLDSQRPFPFDDWSLKGSGNVHPDTWRALTSSECHQLLDSGVIEFGSHTHTHEDFRNRPDAFEESLGASLKVLRQDFGVVNPTLSLPYGIVTAGFAGPAYNATARRLGAVCCLTTEEELLAPSSSPFGWGRFIAEQHDTAATLAVKLAGWRDVARNQWRRLRGRNLQQ